VCFREEFVLVKAASSAGSRTTVAIPPRQTGQQLMANHWALIPSEQADRDRLDQARQDRLALGLPTKGKAEVDSAPMPAADARTVLSNQELSDAEDRLPRFARNVVMPFLLPPQPLSGR